MTKNIYTKDSDLINGLKAENPNALRYLYKLHYPMILNFILNNSGSEEDAKDIYQNAVIIFLDRVKSENFVLTSKIKTFIYSICRRLWLKELNKIQTNISDKFIDIDNFIIIEEESKEEQNLSETAKLSKALEKLGEPCRTIINDFYVENLSMKEICEKMGYTNPENAKTQKYKCFKRLKKIFFEI